MASGVIRQLCSLLRPLFSVDAIRRKCTLDIHKDPWSLALANIPQERKCIVAESRELEVVGRPVVS